MTKKQKKALIRIAIASVLTVVLGFLPVYGTVRFLLYLITYLIIGYDVLKKAFKGIVNRQIFDENFLMAVSTVGAMIIGVFVSGDYTEAIAVMLFYQIGELFQSYAVGKSRKNITELMDIRPDYANIEKDGEILRVDPDEIKPGTHIIVQPGEKVPIDGIVTEGTSSLNTVALTGESAPRDVCPGDEVISGCINVGGVLEVCTTREFGESAVSKILELVENASSRKSKSENFISVFARFYTPVVCICALALAFIPPVVSALIIRSAARWSVWIYRALSFLVASCPCALVISIPLSFFGGIGGASREGILVKGSNFLEDLAHTKCVVFDKTGTLTNGTFEVSKICGSSLSPEKLIEYAALAECVSSHPIAQSLIRAYGKTPDRSRVWDVREIGGRGITATVDGKKIAVGNAGLMEDMGIECIGIQEHGTVVHLAADGEYGGYIIIADTIKTNSEKAVLSLKKCGITKTVMLTGDEHSVALDVSQKLGIDEVYSGLLPDEKVAHVEEMIALERSKDKLAFVGDGINDAPVLARADIGIAMGALGSDAAIEAADVVIMDDDPLKISKAIRIARKCISIVRQNTVFAISVKVLSLVLVAFGVANMWIAVFADVGVMILAVLNAIRALFVKKV